MFDRSTASIDPAVHVDIGRSTDPSASYVDHGLLVLRRRAEQFDPEAPYDEALVLDVGVSGSLDLGGIDSDVTRWLFQDAGYQGWSLVDTQHHAANVGASGAALTLIVTLLGEAAASVGLERLLDYCVDVISRRAGASQPAPPLAHRFQDVDGMKHAVAEAFDRRMSELTLLERRDNDVRSAAVFEDRDGVRYGVKIWDNGALQIKRLAVDEYDA